MRQAREGTAVDKRTFMKLLGAGSTGILAGCLSGGGGTQSVRIGGAQQGGSYYPIAAGFAQIITEAVEGMDGSAQETAGSIENVRLIGQDELELIMVNPLFLPAAQNGEDPFEQAITNLAVVMPTTSYLEAFVAVSDDIQSVSDLNGKTVVTGAPGSGMESQADQIIELLGLDVSKERLGFGDAASALADGIVDAWFTVLGVPATTELAQTNDLRVIPFSDEEITQISEAEVAWKRTQIEPGQVADGFPQESATAIYLIGNGLVANTNLLDEDQVYRITEATFDNVDILQEKPRMGDFTLEKAAELQLDFTYHPGAKRYFEEQGVWS